LLATSSVPFDNVRSVFSWDHTLVLDPKLITSNKISLLNPTSLITTLSTHSSFLQTVATDNLADVPLPSNLPVIRNTFADRAQDEVILEAQPKGDGEIDAPDAVAEGRTVATNAAMERVLAKENILKAIIDGWKWCDVMIRGRGQGFDRG
jgi:hypothetical protein